jgi:hypothetical protein
MLKHLNNYILHTARKLINYKKTHKKWQRERLLPIKQINV